jgi:hypothetical protein
LYGGLLAYVLELLAGGHPMYLRSLFGANSRTDTRWQRRRWSFRLGHHRRCFVWTYGG